jgi:hypothetical protein
MNKLVIPPEIMEQLKLDEFAYLEVSSRAGTLVIEVKDSRQEPYKSKAFLLIEEGIEKVSLAPMPRLFSQEDMSKSFSDAIKENFGGD